MDNQEFPRIIYQLLSGIAVTGQCDACSPVVFAKPETLHSNSSHYFTSPFLVQQPIDLKHDVLVSPVTPSFSVLNKSCFNYLQQFSSPKSLETGVQDLVCETGWDRSIIHSTLDQMVSLGLLVPEDYALQNKFCPPQEVRHTLAAWLHITDSCNLSCSYCYLPHKNTEMSLETGRAAIDATFRSAIRHNYQEVKFKYAGGESLLRFPFVMELHRYAQKLAEQNGLGLDEVVLSNGTLLTREMVKQMQALGLRLTISLDGLPTPGPSQEGNLHPPTPLKGGIQRIPLKGGIQRIPLKEGIQRIPLKGGIQRMYPDGRDAAADAMRGIELTLECGLTPDITITVSGRNVGQLPELLEWVLERDLPFSLNFYRDPSTSPFDFAQDRLRMTYCDDLKIEEERFIKGMLAAYTVIEANLSRRSLLASLADMANFAAPHLRRCSVGHSYLVFDTEGRVSKCQMQMDKPVTDIYADDPLALMRADKSGIQNLSVEAKEECQTCQWRYWCGGGCPLETYRMTGRYDVKSPHCNIYKALYPEVLRLEGLRLLKYADEIEHG